MKKLTIALAALLISAVAYGQTIPAANQGTVTINNLPGGNRFVLPTDPTTGASSSVGTDFSVNFLGGAVGATGAGLVPLVPSSSVFRGVAGSAGAGYIKAVTATVPNVIAGGNADIIVRVLGPNNFTQDFKYTVNGLGGDPGTGVPPATPPNLSFGTGVQVVNFTNVPEPATLALGALGLGAALLFRRRQ